jgi:hypothetical protein
MLTTICQRYDVHRLFYWQYYRTILVLPIRGSTLSCKWELSFGVYPIADMLAEWFPSNYSLLCLCSSDDRHSSSVALP